jgi:tRNA (guanine-N7-)-methyltransferase
MIASFHFVIGLSILLLYQETSHGLFLTKFRTYLNHFQLMAQNINLMPVILKKKSRSAEMPLSQKWYKARQQHLSKNQKSILKNYWPQFGIDLKYNTTIDIVNVFNNQIIQVQEVKKYVVLDIGFGNGDSILALSPLWKNSTFLGVELHKASLANTINKFILYNITNSKVIRSDILFFLENHLPNDTIDAVHLFFPDPWPNSFRDGERRIIRPYILNLLKSKVKINGKFRISTDSEPYANHIIDTFNNNNNNFENKIGNNVNVNKIWKLNFFDSYKLVNNNNNNTSNSAINRPYWRPIMTQYEEKSILNNSTIFNFEYELFLLNNIIT